MKRTVIDKVKGTRDFYPGQMLFRKWLYSKTQDVADLYGYEEFDGPELERIELYTEKTSEEIVREQTFTLTDRDGRQLALRPEITPTFARMVAQRSEELVFPLRWQSFGRAWRYEQPQKGRGREFFQWEVNILGLEKPEADAEIIAMAADFLQSLGLTSDEVVIRINDRSLIETILTDLNIGNDLRLPILRIIDRKEKMSETAFQASLIEIGLSSEQVTGVIAFLEAKDYSKSEWLNAIFESLKDYPEVSEFVQFDPIIVRGFDYYTRTVFEAWDRTGGLRRALFGGGRFDNLTQTLGGKRIPGVGMAPGDMPIEVLLRQFEKMPELSLQAPAILVTALDDTMAASSRQLTSQLRAKGISTELWLDASTELGKRLKYAASKGIRYVAIVAPREQAQGQLVLRDLRNSSQETVSKEELLSLLLK